MAWGVPDSSMSGLAGTAGKSAPYDDVFIAIETEPQPVAGGTSPLDVLRSAFTGKCTDRVRGHLRQKFPGGPSQVRRPSMGLEVKAERHAFLQVFNSSGLPVPLYNQVGGWHAPKEKQDMFPGEQELQKSEHYTDFMITSVQEQRHEKIQIVETFGEDYIYATGQRPQVLAVTGYLCNSADFPWRAEFWSNYNRYLRGSRLIENRYSAYFGWDDIICEGFLMSAGASESAETPDIVIFNFTFLVVDYISLAEMSFQSILQNLERTDTSAFWELTQRGEPRIYTDNNIVLTSEGMRARQRFAQAAGIPGLGPFMELLRVNPALIDQLVSDPKAYLAILGKQTLGKVLDKGQDLLWEHLGSNYDQAMLLKSQSCSRSSLTGRMLFEEGWKTATGWIRKILSIMERVGVPVAPGWPTMWWDLKYSLAEPLNFLKVICVNVGGKSTTDNKIFAGIGVLAAAVLAGAFVVDFAASFVPAGSTLTAMNSGTSVAKSFL